MPYAALLALFPLALPVACWAESDACAWLCAALSAAACLAIAVSAAAALFGGASFVQAMRGLDAIRD